MKTLARKYLAASILSIAVCAILAFLAFTANTETAQFVLAATAGAFLASSLIFAVFWDTEKIG